VYPDREAARSICFYLILLPGFSLIRPGQSTPLHLEKISTGILKP